MKQGKKTGLSEEGARLRELIKAVDGGDVSKAKELRELIESRDYLRKIGDAHSRIFNHLLGQMAGDKASTVEFILSHTAQRKTALGYDESSELERMMIDRIVMCWFRVVQAEGYCVSLEGKGRTFKEHEFAERNLTRANSRFLKSCEALSRYRVMIQATRVVTAKADLIEAQAAKVRGKLQPAEATQPPAPLALVKETA